MACFSACIFVNTALSEQLNLPNTNTDYRKEGQERVSREERCDEGWEWVGGRVEGRGQVSKGAKKGEKGKRVRMGGEV